MISGAKKKRPTLRVPSFSGVVGWGGIVLQLGRPWEGGDNFCLVNTVHARLGGGLLVTAF